MRRLLVWLSWRSHRATPKITPPASCTQERKKKDLHYFLSCFFSFTLMKRWGGSESLKCLIFTRDVASILKQTCSYQFLRLFSRESAETSGTAQDQIRVQTFLLKSLCVRVQLSVNRPLPFKRSDEGTSWHLDDLQHGPCPHNNVSLFLQHCVVQLHLPWSLLFIKSLINQKCPDKRVVL